MIIVFLGILVMGLLLLIGYSVGSAEAYEGQIDKVYFQITQDAKTTVNHDKFIQEINAYIKTQSAKNVGEKQLMELIVKFKHSYILKIDKIEYKEHMKKYVEEQMEITEAKKKFHIIKNKIVLDNFRNHKFHQNLDLEVLEYSMTQNDPRIIQMALNSIVKNYKNFAEFKDKDFQVEIDELRKKIKLGIKYKSLDENYALKIKILKSMKDFNSKTKNKVDAIQKSYARYVDNGSSPKSCIINPELTFCKMKDDNAKPPKDTKPPKDPKPPKKPKEKK